MSDLIADYARHLYALGRAKSTIDGYTELLHRMDRQLPAGLSSACTEELRAWVWADGHGRTTRSLYTTVVKGYFAWATDPGRPLLDFDPAARLPKVRPLRGLPRPIPAGQHADIMARAARPYRDWFVIASYTGARCLEIAALDVEHITAETVWLQGKGDRPRHVPTRPEVWALAQTLPAGPVACDSDGSRLTRQQVSHRGNHQLRTTLGHPGVSMHRLRHTFGTAAYAACRDLRAVQELMGHASSATTERYVAVSQGAMQQAVMGMTVAA